MFAKTENVAQETRFRKRDKALFYGRKMIRKVKNISGQVRTSGQGKKRKMVMKLARKILQLKKDTDQEQLKVRQTYLQKLFYVLFNLSKEFAIVLPLQNPSLHFIISFPRKISGLQHLSSVLQTAYMMLMQSASKLLTKTFEMCINLI